MPGALGPGTTTGDLQWSPYQTTSREYIELLRGQIGGEATTLTTPTPVGRAVAYIAQSDPFFDRLRVWGDAIWQLWEHNMNVPGAAPVITTQAVWP